MGLRKTRPGKPKGNSIKDIRTDPNGSWRMQWLVFSTLRRFYHTLCTGATSELDAIRQHHPPVSLFQYPLVQMSHRFFSCEYVGRDWNLASQPLPIPTTQRFLFSAPIHIRL